MGEQTFEEHEYPGEGPEQSGKHPGAAPSSQISGPARRLSPQIEAHEDHVEGDPGMQVHFGSFEEQSYLQPVTEYGAR